MNRIPFHRISKFKSKGCENGIANFDYFATLQQRSREKKVKLNITNLHKEGWNRYFTDFRITAPRRMKRGEKQKKIKYIFLKFSEFKFLGK